MKRVLLFSLVLLTLALAMPKRADALVCWTQRVINQHRCVGTQSSCFMFRSQSRYSGCSASGGSASSAKSACESSCAGPYSGPQCYDAYCTNYTNNTYECDVENYVAGCFPEPRCEAIANIANCDVNYDGSSCSQTTQSLTYGCWGPGNPTGTATPTTCGNGICGSGESCLTCPSDCGSCCGNGSCGAGETCTNCAADCGSCPPTCGNGSCGSGESCDNCPSDCGVCVNPTSTPGPTSAPTPFCGNGSCNSGENCSNCPSDCGSCPGNTNTPTPTPFWDQCAAPPPRDPPSSTCAACPTCNGTITWSWDAVPNATEYELTILNASFGVVQDIGWQTAATFGCDGSAVCSYTTSQVPGTYMSRIRARGTCNESTYSYSNPFTSGLCNGTISAVAKLVDANASSCTDVTNSPNYVYPVSFSLSPNVPPGAQIQTGSTAVTWSDVAPNTYTLSVSPPSGYIVRFMCWQRSFTAPTTGNGPSASITNSESLSWYGIGLSLGTPWVQTQGGDVMVATNIQSHLADTVAPREFNIAGSGGYPGIVSYGTAYDFDPLSTSTGGSFVSATDWVANEPGLPPYSKDWYNAFAEKYDLTGNSQSYSGPAKPASSDIPYAVNGPLTIGNWNVANGESIVLFVNGDLTINGPITSAGTGFVAFIVNGDITISSNVGVAYNSSTPSLRGLYVANGTFNTGASQIGIQRLVGQGIFIANSFQLLRDLSNAGGGQNHTTSSELFIYDPQLLVTMPDEFRDIRLKWEEVAP